MSIRSKIIILFISLTIVISLLLSLYIYVFTTNAVKNDFFHRMKVRAEIAARYNHIDNGDETAFFNELRQKHLVLLPEEKEYIFTSAIPPAFFDSLGINPPAEFYLQLQQNKEARFNQGDTYFYATSLMNGNSEKTVLTTAVNEQGKSMLKNFSGKFIIGFLVSLSLVLILSLVLSKEIVSPLKKIIDNVQKITASNLNMRLGLPESGGEIAALTQTFNDMLDRLETSFETQNNFLSKAAHELRTPLTAIIGEAELALSRERSPGEYEKALNIIIKEAEQMRHHTSSLLELAQAGYNSKEPFKTELRVDELLFSVKRLVDFTDPANNVQINLDLLPEAENKITIYGNANLLKLAVANIVQNGCKYSNNAPVYVSLHTTEFNCKITIQDNGIGIPQKELKYIFDPFFRASNTDPFKGYGIGLPLSQKIIRLHRGTLEYTSIENKGTTAVITIPFISL